MIRVEENGMKSQQEEGMAAFHLPQMLICHHQA